MYIVHDISSQSYAVDIDEFIRGSYTGLEISHTDLRLMVVIEQCKYVQFQVQPVPHTY
jgi:hypothetical protein